MVNRFQDDVSRKPTSASTSGFGKPKRHFTFLTTTVHILLQQLLLQRSRSATSLSSHDDYQ
ncbi:MAG: hypothetical protein LKK12_08875 [Bacteroidales bacterium]|nr:hypothetical protein [Bacteroidales bacterium]MCI2134473.1 hypothetical protein [Bacteroidales bacterium]